MNWPDKFLRSQTAAVLKDIWATTSIGYAQRNLRSIEQTRRTSSGGGPDRQEGWTTAPLGVNVKEVRAEGRRQVCFGVISSGRRAISP
jgi:hypothetical protein